MGLDPLRVVAIGGGTGLSTLLRGLREHVWPGVRHDGRAAIADLSAIVTVTDDGGSSGRIRREFNMLPPGDVRRCLVALSEDEDLLSKLFEYRFRQGRGLLGHSLGNLLLTALTEITGDFGRALEAASEVLATCGHIFPATLKQVRLRAKLADGQVVTGETRISASKAPILRLSLTPSGCRPVPEAIRAIEGAGLITVGPGSLYTSIIPNILVTELKKKIVASKAVKVYIGNLMTQPGETQGMSAAGHIRAIYRHAGTEFFDYAILSRARVASRLLRRYESEGATVVENDLHDIRSLGVIPVLDDLVAPGNVVRHNPGVLAKAVLKLRRAEIPK